MIVTTENTKDSKTPLLELISKLNNLLYTKSSYKNILHFLYKSNGQINDEMF